MTLANLIGFPERRPGTAANPPVHVQRALTVCESLMSERGEISGVRLASQVLSAYETFDPASRDAFFAALASRFSPDPAEAGRQADAYRQDPTATNLTALQRAVESPRHELFSRLNTAPGGTRVLANMRAHILRGLASHPEWAAVEADLGRLLAAWFNRGFVTLRRIDWNTPASILEKLIHYEAVHAIQGWPDLHRRLQADQIGRAHV